MKIPEKVPVMKPEMLAKGTPGFGNYRCLYGWLAHVFEDSYADAMTAMGFVSMRAVTEFNDTIARPIVAEHWNRTMESLGYTRRGDLFYRD